MSREMKIIFLFSDWKLKEKENCFDCHARSLNFDSSQLKEQILVESMSRFVFISSFEHCWIMKIDRWLILFYDARRSNLLNSLRVDSPLVEENLRDQRIVFFHLCGSFVDGFHEESVVWTNLCSALINRGKDVSASLFGTFERKEKFPDERASAESLFPLWASSWRRK